MLQAIGVSLLGGLATYVLARIGTKGGAAAPVVPGLVAPTVPTVPTLPVAPVETKPPPVAPPPPVDKAPTLPTPAAPPPVAPPPPATVAPPAPVIELPVSKPAPVDVAPPPPPPPPPVDTAPTLPTPPVDRPERPFSDAVVEVDSPARGPAVGPISTPATEPSVPVDTAKGPPAGFDPTIASTLAPSVASNIASKQYDFDRSLLKKFQAAAGIDADGIYGNDSWGALLYFTSAAPRALYQPNVPTPYAWGPWVTRSAPAAPSSSTPAAPAPAAPVAPVAPAVDVGPVPPAGFNPTSAKKLAKQVAANIDSKGVNYSQAQLKQFQTAAGIASDGLYGGGSRRALIFYGIARPPQPLFKPTATPATYPWEAQAKAALS